MKMTDANTEPSVNRNGKSLAQIHREAVKNKETEEVSVTYFSFQEDGEVFIGRLLYSEEKESVDTGKTYFSHVFETDKGVMNAIFGVMFDNITKAKDYTGRILAVTFKGKEEIPGGKTVNKYLVEVVPG